MQKTVLITGGTSGIGLALAREYLAQGDKVIITGRTLDKVRSSIEELKANSNFLEGKLIDVTDEQAMFNYINYCDDKYILDVVIANAGISARMVALCDLQPPLSQQAINDTPLYSSPFHRQAKEIYNINVLGTFNTIHPAIERMKHRQRGTIVLMGSMSSFFGMKTAVPYASSKAAIKSYGEGLRLLLKKCNIQVTTVFPGFVESNITKQNTFKMPFFMSKEKAAKIILKALKKNKGYIIFPIRMYLLVYFISILPFGLREKIVNKFPEKK
ncbi:SDR family NAD(P)-dependent oxidoreductase [Candidatus Hepatincolaceae symbiont of Richtersius coronifer]